MKSNRFIGIVESILIATVVFLNGLIIQTPLPDSLDWKFLDKFGQAIADVAFLDIYLKRNPNSATGYAARARAYAVNGIWGEVVKNCNRAIELDRDDPEFFRLRGKALFELDENEKALADFNHIVDGGSATAEDLSIVSVLNTRLHRLDEAIRAANGALEKHAYWSTAFEARALAEYELGQYDQAMLDAQKSIEMYKERPIPFVIMSAVLNDRGETEKAIAMAREAIKRDAACGAAYWQLAVAQDKLKQFEEALSSANLALSLATTDEWRSREFGSRALVYLHMGKPDLAQQDCQAALKIDPGCKTAIEARKEIESVYSSNKSG